MSNILVSVVMGSKSDWAIMEETCHILDKINIPNEARAIQRIELLMHYLITLNQLPKWIPYF